MRILRLQLLAVLAIITAACDTTSSSDLEFNYVVESVLAAGQSMPPLLLSTTGDLEEEFLFESHAVSGATVSVRVTGPQEDALILYEELDEFKGGYVPVEYDKPVLPLHRYDLEILPEGTPHRITASTVVPDTFSILSTPQAELIYQGSEQLEMRLTRSDYPGRDQSYYIFVTESLDPLESNLVPIAEALFDDGEGESLEELRVNGSPIVNEDNYDVSDDGSLFLRYPWIGIYFYGANIVHINALDDNLYDFERSRAIQEGGSTFAPGEIPNPLSHVRGAHGVFASYAHVSVRLNVLQQ